MRYTLSEQKQIVVLHAVDDAKDARRAVATAGKLRESFPDARVTIVVNGPALDGLAELDMSRLPESTEVAACAVGLKMREIAESSLPAGVEVVPTAPEKIVSEQFSGAAYIRL